MKSLKTIFSKNKNTQIVGNQIGIINNFYSLNSFIYNETNIDFTLRNSKKYNELFEDKRIVDSPIFRHILENVKFEQIIRLSQLYKDKPILRMYGCFTSLSSIRQKSETSELAQLELLEKENILKFIENDYETKIIISLDENMIFANNIYNVEQYMERCRDLINTIKQYNEYKNLKIVIDNGNNLESMYIFDTLLICYLPTILFDSDKITYGQAVFDSDINIIANKIKIFDKRFSFLEKCNNEMRQYMQQYMRCKDQETFLHYIVESRKNDYFNNLNFN